MSYGTVENGEVVINSKSFDANVTPVSFDGSGYPGAYVYQYGGNSNWYYYSYANLKDFAFGIDYIAPFDPSVYGSWSVNSSGRITGKIKPQPLIGMPPPIGGIKGGKGFSKMGKSIGNMTGNRNVQQKQFDSVVKQLNLSKDEARQLHEAIHGQGYGYQEILQEAKLLFDK